MGINLKIKGVGRVVDCTGLQNQQDIILRVGSNPTLPVLRKINKEKKMITREQKLAMMKDRLKKLNESPKNIKCGGVVRKLTRQIRNLEN